MVTNQMKANLALLLVLLGVCFNVSALFVENSGAFVAIGCSMLAIGIATRKLNQKKTQVSNEQGQ